jgi:hypothetical protein
MCPYCGGEGELLEILGEFPSLYKCKECGLIYDALEGVD